jgi:hypothetical protein
MIALLLEVPGAHPLNLGAAAAREGMLGVARFMADHASEVIEVVDVARRRTLQGAPGEVYVAIEPTAHPEPEPFWVMQGTPGRRVPALVVGEVRTLHVPSVTRPAPWGYALTTDVNEVAALLDLHGLSYVRLEQGMTQQVEAYRLHSIEREENLYQNHHRLDPVVEVDGATVDLPPGALIIPVAQRGGRLVPQLFEPDAVDSLLRWNFFDSALARMGGAERSLPIYRLLGPPFGTAR